MLDRGENSEVDIQGDIEFPLIQMKAETLNKIDVAKKLVRRPSSVSASCRVAVPHRSLSKCPAKTLDHAAPVEGARHLPSRATTWYEILKIRLASQ